VRLVLGPIWLAAFDYAIEMASGLLILSLTGSFGRRMGLIAGERVGFWMQKAPVSVQCLFRKIYKWRVHRCYATKAF